MSTLTPDTLEADASTAYAMFAGQHGSIVQALTRQEVFAIAFILGYQAAAEHMMENLKAEEQQFLLSLTPMPVGGRYVESTITGDFMIELRMGASQI